MEKLKGIHFTWFGLAGLWLLAFIPATISTTAKPQLVLSYGPPPDRTVESLFVMAFLAYLVGGVILGKLHNRYVAGFATAQVEESETANGREFKITPAGRHLPFWLFGLFGAFFLMSVPYMIAGNGFGTTFTLMFAGTFALIGLRPKLWRKSAPHGFMIGKSALTAAGRTLPFASIQGFRIDTALKGKSDLAAPNGGGYYQPAQQATVYVGNISPGAQFAAHGIAAGSQVIAGASGAAAEGIAEVANRYFREMQARSWRIEAEGVGQHLLLAEGLDPATARNLVSRIQSIIADQANS